MRLLNFDYIDDFEFIGDIGNYKHELLQAEIDIVVDWSDENFVCRCLMRSYLYCIADPINQRIACAGKP